MIFYLERHPAEGKAIPGSLYLNLKGKNFACGRTLENVDYVIPDGTYTVEVNYSPKFKRDMPILRDVPGRTGIRMHRGTKPEHSKGCILLLNKEMEGKITRALQIFKEEAKIVISSIKPLYLK